MTATLKDFKTTILKMQEAKKRKAEKVIKEYCITKYMKVAPKRVVSKSLKAFRI